MTRPALRPLSILDAAFLQLETAATPMHVGALFVCAPPRGGAARYAARLRERLAERLWHCELLTRRLAPLPFDLANPLWTDAAEVDLDWHVRRSRLRAPARPGDLERAVARLHAERLPRDRPLWQFHVFEGLPRGRVALYVKMHHAGLDGASAQVFLRQVVDGAAGDAPARPPAAPAGTLAVLGGALRHQLGEAARLPATLVELGRAAAALARRRGGAATPPNPRTPLNRVIGPARSFAACAVPLATARAAARAREGTVNDLVLAACAGALRRYLARRGALPAAPLLAAVPVSLRAAGDEAQTIQVTFMGVDLHTDLADRAARFAAIHRSAGESKALTQQLRTALPRDLPSIGLPWLLAAVVRAIGTEAVVERVPLPFNVLVSNVPGPEQPIRIAGARVLSYTPLSIPYHGAALNITVHSYAGRLFFGLTGCRKALPDMAQLAADLQSELAALARRPATAPVVRTFAAD